jgi:hypothetical protein
MSTRIVHIPPHRRLWLVGFRDRQEGEPWHWTRLFTRPGFRHLIAVAESHGDTLVVNPLTHRIDVQHLKAPLGLTVRELMRHGFRFLAYETEALPRYLPVRLLTCVEVVKALLGVRRWTVFTAAQLYVELVALGAHHVGPAAPSKEGAPS